MLDHGELRLNGLVQPDFFILSKLVFKFKLLVEGALIVLETPVLVFAEIPLATLQLRLRLDLAQRLLSLLVLVGQLSFQI